MKYRKLGNTGIDISEIGFGILGLGDEVSMAIGHMGNAEQFRLGINDAFINNYGTYEEICKSLGLDSDSIAEKIKEIIGFNGKIVFDTTKPDGMMRKLLDVGKINNLGWKAKTDFKEGIKSAYGWFVKNESKEKIEKIKYIEKQRKNSKTYIFKEYRFFNTKLNGDAI